MIGHKAWNKGMKGLQPWHNIKGLNAKGDIPWNKGKFGFQKVSKETKSKMSESKKGNNNYWFGKKMSIELRNKLSISHLGKKHTKEQIRKILHRRPKSSLEIKFENIINDNELPYKFVGNGEFIIERKNPDFINTNGKKIAIEVYYRKHKNMFRNGLEDWKDNRKQVFSKYGWELLFFDETEVNEDNVRRVLSL